MSDGSLNQQIVRTESLTPYQVICNKQGMRLQKVEEEDDHSLLERIITQVEGLERDIHKLYKDEDRVKNFFYKEMSVLNDEINSLRYNAQERQKMNLFSVLKNLEEKLDKAEERLETLLAKKKGGTTTICSWIKPISLLSLNALFVILVTNMVISYRIEDQDKCFNNIDELDDFLYINNFLDKNISANDVKFFTTNFNTLYPKITGCIPTLTGQRISPHETFLDIIPSFCHTIYQNLPSSPHFLRFFHPSMSPSI